MANQEMILTFVILAVTILLFVFSKLRADLVALLALLALFLTGILTSQQALAGFSDSTVIMVAALFVVGEALSRTGITAWLGQVLMKQAGDSDVRLLLVLMLGTAVLSAFMSNTGTVAMLMPAIIAAAWRIGSVPSKFLIPLALAANLGGLMTLIGSPPNIIVADTLTAAGLETFSFFEFAWIGVPLVLATVAFIVLLGRRLLPARESGERPVDLDAALRTLAQSHRLPSKLFWTHIPAGSSVAYKTLAETAFGREFGVTVLYVQHTNGSEAGNASATANSLAAKLKQLDQTSEVEPLPGAQTMLRPGDALLLKGNPGKIEDLAQHFGLQVRPADGAQDRLGSRLVTQEVGVAEVIIAPRSEYAGRSLADGQVGEKFNVQVLTIQRGDKVLPRQDTRLQFGDTLLVRGAWRDIERLQDEARNFAVVGSPEAMARQVVAWTPRAVISVLALALMVVLMVTSVVPSVIAVLIAAAIVVLAGCVSPEGAYRSINWQVVVLIAATIPLSTALEVTGGAALIANALVSTLGSLGPLVLLAGVFLLTTAFSQVMSNTATTVLIAPIVLQAALDLGVAPQPMLMMVAVGAAAAFLTPIASPTNTLVLTPGGYTWGDYAKIGLPLMIIVLAVSVIVVPLVWPL